MSRCTSLLPLTIDRTTQDTPFYGLNESTLVYLPAGKTQPSDNVVMDGKCSRLVLSDQFGFTGGDGGDGPSNLRRHRDHTNWDEE